jgi:hypothetical protein
MDRWSFYQVISYDRKGREVYYDRPPSFGKFLILILHAFIRWAPFKGHRTRFKAGAVKWSMRCRRLPWRPW